MSSPREVTPSKVVYPFLPLDQEYLCVDLLSERAARTLTSEFLRLVVAAYGTQFEHKTNLLPPGTFATKYATKAQQQRFHSKVIPGVYERGGGYLAVRNPVDQERLVGVLKVLPGSSVEGRFEGMTAIAEVLTDPEYQGRSIGAAMVHTHLMLQGSEVRGVVLDAFDHNPVNAWYEKMGLEYEAPSDPLTFAGGHELSGRYMATPPETTARHVAEYLMTKAAPLQYPVPKFSAQEV